MKYCTQCRKELLDEAVVCTKCGCKLDEVKTQAVEKKTNKKKILISVAVVALVILIVAGKLFITYNPIRAIQIKEQLAGHLFKSESYSSSNYIEASIMFDEGDAECTRSHSGVLADTHSWSVAYKIKFKNREVFLVCTDGDVFKIRYDKNGNIESLYGVNTRVIYKICH